MGGELHRSRPAARRVWELADEVLDFSLSRLAFEGPREELDDTINAQPALLACSLAAWQVRQEDGFPSPEFVAGHSLGEYSALTAAGSLDPEAALRLVRERGRLMKEAGRSRPGAMAAVLGLEPRAVQELAAQAGVVVANDNCPGQVVVSGPSEAVGRAVELARRHGGKAMPLAVTIASHSPLMEPAAVGLKAALDSATIRRPRIPVVLNVRARPESEPAAIRRALAEQLTGRVRWRETLLYLAGEGCDRFLELGAGRVLSGLVRRTLPEAQVESFG